MTTPEPIKKSIKTSTKDLKVYANTQIDARIKRDSFVEEMIADYFKRKWVLEDSFRINIFC